MSGRRRIVIIAGPNGAGKTTFACEFLPREAECPDFINPVYVLKNGRIVDLTKEWKRRARSR